MIHAYVQRLDPNVVGVISLESFKLRWVPRPQPADGVGATQEQAALLIRALHLQGAGKCQAVDRELRYSTPAPRKLPPLSITAGGGSLLPGTRVCNPETGAVPRSSPQKVHSWTAWISHYVRSGQGNKALKLYEDMRTKKVEPSPHTLVVLLQACASLQDLNMAKQIHSEIVRTGFVADLHVGTMLVDAYAKCGSLVDAIRAFEAMPLHDVVSWNAIILRCAQMDQGKEALRLYARMQLEGVAPDERTYVSTLKACRSMAEQDKRSNGAITSEKGKVLQIVRAVHGDIQNRKFDRCSILGNMLIDVYAKCHSLKDARIVFENMPQRTVVSWNSIILGYAEDHQANEALQLYTRMQEEGFVPNDRTIVSALKACSSLTECEDSDAGYGSVLKQGCLKTVRAIHTNAVIGRCESDIYVGNLLVDVYSKCGSLKDARAVFENMPKRTVVSWTCMILGYAHEDKGEEALKLFSRMKLEGFVPDGRTYVGALKACICSLEVKDRTAGDSIDARRRCLEAVQTIHEEILKAKCESDVRVSTMLVDVYTKCWSLDNARLVFEKVRCRDVVCWNVLILGYAQMGMGEQSLQLYDRMQQEGITPDNRTYVGALKACGSLAGSEGTIDTNQVHVNANDESSLKIVKRIHEDLLRSKLEGDVFVGTMLIDVYAKFGSLKDARRVFDEMPNSDVVLWNAMISGYAQMDAGEEALELYSQMQMAGVTPDDRTFVSVLKACSSLASFDEKNGSDRLSCLETVRAVHAELSVRNFDSDIFVCNMLVDVYAKCGSMKDARLVFEAMPYRSVLSWAVMISGYTQTDEAEEALHLFARLQIEGLIPDGRTYVNALKACKRLAEIEDYNECNGVKERSLAIVKGIHDTIVQRNFEPDVFLCTMLVDVYAKCGSLEDARCVFEKMDHRTVASWNAMILGYAQLEEGDEALHLYTRMRQAGVASNGLTHIAALAACANLANLEKGKEVYAHILEGDHLAVESFVANALIDMYATCGSMLHAQAVFDALPTRDPAAWNALIAGYARQGESELVFHLFREMTSEGIQPNASTFLSILTTCSHGGLVDDGRQFFEAMSRDYGIAPSIKHYTCMVDLLGRAGYLHEALEMVGAMPHQPQSAQWRSILGACRKWRNVELGRSAFEWVTRLDKSDGAAYMLMSNIYADARMQEEAEQVQSMKVKSHAWKEPGRSCWTDTGGVTHVFQVGGRGHPGIQDLREKLQCIGFHLKNDG